MVSSMDLDNQRKHQLQKDNSMKSLRRMSSRGNVTGVQATQMLRKPTNAPEELRSSKDGRATARGRDSSGDLQIKVGSLCAEEDRALGQGFTIPDEVSELMKSCKLPSQDLERGAEVRGKRGGAKLYLSLRHGQLRNRTCELRILEDTKNQSKLRAFLQELVVRHQLEHPHLRKLLGISTFPAYTIVLSDSKGSCSLRDLLWTKEGMELSLYQGLADILRDVAAGLGRLHEAKAVHGSISAENGESWLDLDARLENDVVSRKSNWRSFLHAVLVTTSNGSPRAQLDGLETVSSNIPEKFGLMPSLAALEIAPAGGKWYQAPEILRGDAPRSASDVYSLGTVSLVAAATTVAVLLVRRRLGEVMGVQKLTLSPFLGCLRDDNSWSTSRSRSFTTEQR